MSDLDTVAYRETFVCWVDIPGDMWPIDGDWDHPYHRDCEWGWCCNLCGRRTDEHPCPDHAPLIVAGLRRVECDADPVHVLLAVDRDDYGHGCPACWANKTSDELNKLLLATHRFRHWRWRRWKLSDRVLSLLHRVGIVRGHAWVHGDGCRGCIDSIRWRWSR